MELHLVVCVSAVAIMVGLTIWLVVREVARWRDPASLVPRQQVVLRIFNCGLIMLMLGQFLWGMLFVNEVSHDFRYRVIYWYNCLGLAFIVTFVGLIDFFYVMRLRRYTRAWLNERLSRLSDCRVGDSGHESGTRQ